MPTRPRWRAALAEAITATLGVSAPVVVVSRDELAEVIAANPFPDEADPKRVHAVLLSGAPGAEAAAKIDEALARSAAKGARDELAIVGRTLYLHTPDGFGNSELAAAVLRIVTLAAGGGDRHRAELGDDDQAARAVRGPVESAA